MQKESTEYLLGLKNWKGIPIDKYDQDFTFVVDGKKYSTPRFVADLLSPKIRKLHFTDASINEFVITTDSQSSQEDHFSDFLNLIQHENKIIDLPLQHLYSTYFLKLGNIDEYIRLSPTFSEPLSIDNSVSRVKEIQKMYEEEGQLIAHDNQQIESIISFISEHFSEFSTDTLNKISVDDLEQILSKDTLKIADEDSLLDFIIEKYSEDRSCSYLFSHVIFSNVSDTLIEKFVNCFSIEDLDEATWESLCGRLLSTCKKDKRREKKRYGTAKKDDRKYKEFKSEKGHEFEGIMHYLTDLTGGNIHDNQTIEITSNSIHGSNHHPKNLVDYQNNNFYHSKNDPSPFVLFDFKDRRVQISDYSIKTYSSGQNDGGHLRNWVLEVSNDGDSWEEIDSHSEDSKLNGSGITANFQVTNANNGFYRYVKLRSTGYSWYNHPSNYHYIYFYFIEFFGKLDEPDKQSN
ncbi:hypothetical protein M9Y10_010153 [Tritrichomonas musculus]|uniref:F5/8 type C domain-containing protein n=1 Tax=Tritrichomonas musculus TaxID=1915356 RepID=A0ABR2IRE2_9EUKA